MNIIKTAGATLKKQKTAAALTFILPLCLMLICSIAEYFIILFFFPLTHSFVKSIGILSVALLLNMLILWPVKLGVKRWYVRLYCNRDSDLLNIFHFYSSFKLFVSSVMLAFLKCLYIGAISIISIIPGIVLFDIFSGKNNFYGVLMSIFALIIGILFISKSLLSLFLSDYLFITKHQNPFKAFWFSLVKMRGNRISLILLTLKFWWRFFSCILIFPLLYFAPLYCQSLAIFAKTLTDSNPSKHNSKA